MSDRKKYGVLLSRDLVRRARALPGMPWSGPIALSRVLELALEDWLNKNAPAPKRQIKPEDKADDKEREG